MAYKVENAMEVEKRVNRIFKDLDINNVVKQIKIVYQSIQLKNKKANNEEVQKEFLIV